jgi:Gas vesicle protein
MGKRFAFGAVIGVVAGVVAGVLTAPKSGKETRADIKTKAQELKDKAAESSDAALDKAARVADDLKERGTHAIDEAKHGFKK